MSRAHAGSGNLANTRGELAALDQGPRHFKASSADARHGFSDSELDAGPTTEEPAREHGEDESDVDPNR